MMFVSEFSKIISKTTFFLLLFTVIWFTLHYDDLAKAFSLHENKTIQSSPLAIANDTTQQSNHEFQNRKSLRDQNSLNLRVFDEKDVVILSEKNFSGFISKNRYVMVNFYASWSYWSKHLAPEYAAAATLLKEEAMLAKVDASRAGKLTHKYGVQGYPSLYFFIDGIYRFQYFGERTRNSLAIGVRKMMQPRVFSIRTTKEAIRISADESMTVLAFFDGLEGLYMEELAAAAKLQTDVNFYQTRSSDVAKMFNIDSQIKNPALIIISRNQTGGYISFDGEFSRLEISEFISMNKSPSENNPMKKTNMK